MAKRKRTKRTKARQVGDVINIQYVRIATDPSGFYWFEVPVRMTIMDDQGFLEELYRSGALHGPFQSQAEAEADSQKVTLGKDCVVTDGGTLPSSGATH